MLKKNYIAPRAKMVYINTHGHFLAGSNGESDNNLGNEGGDGDMGAKRAYGRFASWEDDDEY